MGGQDSQGVGLVLWQAVCVTCTLNCEHVGIQNKTGKPFFTWLGGMANLKISTSILLAMGDEADSQPKVFRLQFNFPYSPFPLDQHHPCCGDLAKVLPWPAHDPPVCSYWNKFDGEAFFVTKHFSGYERWVPAKDHLLRCYTNLHGVKKGRAMVNQMLPVVGAFLGIPAVDTTSHGLDFTVRFKK